ncbi:N(G),N(G)-dimethylarginine dimethylaminohydrolase 1-like [Babylonia areolata]|uniref:N(G),N(G)-dimethylarginine dimethylaminohydrolase 1-like n=1 Tax=Babylonia areolata TaxID=304850 RepID=UPI003FD37AC1
MLLRQLCKTYSSMMGLRAFKYTHAIMRELPNSFAENAVKMDSSQQISLTRAKEQWNNYRETLEQCSLKVITLPADEKYPDCTFVEDVAVVIGQKACMTRLGHPSRVNEGVPIQECLRSLGFQVDEMDDPAATMDGGDVLFTGKEIFVGLSSRTNKAGLDCLQRVFSDFPVTGIPVTGTLHLKSVVTMAQEGVLLMGSSAASQTALKVLQEKSREQYQIIQLEKDRSANVLFVNGQTILKDQKDLGNDFKKITSCLTVPWVEVTFDELYKADGCLTCCSILVQAPKDTC